MINGTYTTGQTGSDDEFSLAVIGDESWRDYAVDVDVSHQNWGCDVCLVVRARGSTFMKFGTDCCKSRLVLVVEGNEQELVEVDEGGLHDLRGRSHLRLEVRGSIYAAYSNGKQILRVQDTTLESGMAGLCSEGCYPNGHSFDNFRVTELK